MTESNWHDPSANPNLVNTNHIKQGKLANKNQGLPSFHAPARCFLWFPKFGISTLPAIAAAGLGTVLLVNPHSTSHVFSSNGFSRTSSTHDACEKKSLFHPWLVENHPPWLSAATLVNPWPGGTPSAMNAARQNHESGASEWCRWCLDDSSPMNAQLSFHKQGDSSPGVSPTSWLILPLEFTLAWFHAPGDSSALSQLLDLFASTWWFGWSIRGDNETSQSHMTRTLLGTKIRRIANSYIGNASNPSPTVYVVLGISMDMVVAVFVDKTVQDGCRPKMVLSFPTCGLSIPYYRPSSKHIYQQMHILSSRIIRCLILLWWRLIKNTYI